MTPPQPNGSGPLVGLRVIEFGNLVAAPYCGMLLADLGAEVIKVEPITGDLARDIGPFVNGESGFFISVNRGKKSLACDPKHARVAALLRRLCLGADVVFHNLRSGAMERMGLGYEDLAPAAPRLIYAVISAFGTTGPYSDRGGIDLVFQGESGMMSITGAEGEGPHKTATTIADFVAGTNAALAIAAALAGRTKSGQGRLIETSLRDGLIAVQAGWNAQYFASGRQPPRTGTASPVTGPNQSFKTSDGFVNLAVVSDRHFADLCRVLGLDRLLDDERYASNELRVLNRQPLALEIESVLIDSSTDHWIERLDSVGIPVGRLMDMERVFSDPQVLFNEMVVEIQHPVAGTIRTQGSPLRIDGQPARSLQLPPVLGEDTRPLLVELDVSEADIDRLRSERAVVLGSVE
ncbi:MAG: CaiB/BaiF CoA transferase family protein [Acidimicrobiia bacterium]